MPKKAIRPLPTQERLHEMFDYDPSTGILTWAVDDPKGGKRRKGRRAGFDLANGSGYRVLMIDCVRYLEHRLIWKWVHGRDPIAEIDHVNRDTSDNRICNLREAGRSDNAFNKSILSNHSNTGYLGVSYYPSLGRFRARIKVEGKYHHLGQHKTLDEALAARREGERRLLNPEFMPS